MTSHTPRSAAEAALLERISDYWNRRAAGYGLFTRDDINGPEAYRWTCHLTNTYPLSGRRVLDVGTGGGFLAILAAKAGADVTAVDISVEMLQAAKVNAQASGCEILFTQSAADRLSFPDESFDVVMCRNVLWNMTDPEAAVAEWVRVLRPGGALFIADGNHYNHLVDSRFKAVRNALDAARSHDPKYLGDVDTSVMEQIARDLPMTSRNRPDWEIGCLESLGLWGVCCRAAYPAAVRLADGCEEVVTLDFIVTAYKPERPCEVPADSAGEVGEQSDGSPDLEPVPTDTVTGEKHTE